MGADFESLVRIADELRMQYEAQNEEWKHSPFAWIKMRPSRQVGAIAEQLLSSWLEEKGLRVEDSPDSEADRIVNGVRVEIKFSTLWSGGFYKFQQLRDQNYSVLLCLGISPFEAHLWAISKEVVIQGWRENWKGLRSQHGGKRGRDTAWLEVDPTEVPEWLEPFGGSLEKGLRALRALLASAD
nr:hypothetical protein [Ardenticatena sp.]